MNNTIDSTQRPASPEELSRLELLSQQLSEIQEALTASKTIVESLEEVIKSRDFEIQSLKNTIAGRDLALQNYAIHFNSHGWQSLRRIYEIGNRWFPMGSLRRKAAGKFISLFRG